MPHGFIYNNIWQHSTNLTIVIDYLSIITLHPPHLWRGARWSLLGGRRRCPPSASWMVLLLLLRQLPGRRWPNAVSSAPSWSGRSAVSWCLRCVPTLRSPVLVALSRWPRWVAAWTASAVSTTTTARDMKVFQTWSVDLASEQTPWKPSLSLYQLSLHHVVLFNARCLCVVRWEQINLINIDKKTTRYGDDVKNKEDTDEMVFKFDMELLSKRGRK